MRNSASQSLIGTSRSEVEGEPSSGRETRSRDSSIRLLITPRTSFSISQHLGYIEKMVAQGGPVPGQYAAFDRWLADISDEVRAGRMSEGELRAIRDSFGRALSTETNQGMALCKPHGYPGDYEIIDRIYREHATGDPDLRNWDLYFHTQAAPRAVRNRKAYFIALLGALVASPEHAKAPALPVLNVASGPARDLLEFFESTDDKRVRFECVDTDANAIAYAEEVCRPYLDRISFKEANALRYTSEQKFKLVWSAGLFDYFGDKGFKFMVERLLPLLDDDGELVIGNFSKANSTRDYMEVMGDWNLYYRTEEELRTLAAGCGVDAKDIHIGREPEGINLFLHIKRGTEFISM